MWKLAWSSTRPGPYFIYVDGVLAARTWATAAILAAEAGSSIEVQDGDEPPVQRGYPAYALIAWWGVSGASGYRVEQYIDSSWVAQRSFEEDGRGYWIWRSASLADLQTHQFRVIAEGTNDSTAVTFAVSMVRRPEVPDVDYAYDAGAVTISAN